MSSVSKLVIPFLALAVVAGAQAQTQPKSGAPARPQAPVSSRPPSAAKTPAKPAGTAQSKAPGAEAAAAPNDLPPTAPVITLEGVCAKTASPATDCKTVITKAEFERLTNALNPDMTDQVKRQLANSYGQMLMLAHAAEQQGLQNSPQAKEILQFARLQGLAQVLVRKTQEEAQNIPPDEIQKYYQEHQSNFEQATMRRLFIPKFKVEKQGDKPVPLEKATVDATAQKIKAAAAAGEPFDKLQKEAYTDLGVTTEPPPTDPVTITREQMPDMHEAAFDLKPGEVSQLFEQPGGIYIYKMEAKKTQSLDQVRAQIEQSLGEARMQSKMHEITKGNAPKLNDDYFGPEAPEQQMPQMPPGHPGQ